MTINIYIHFLHDLLYFISAYGRIMKVAVYSMLVVVFIGSGTSHPKVDRDAMEDIIQDILGSRALMNDQAGEISDIAASTELPLPPTPPPPRSASANIPSHPISGDVTVSASVARSSSTPGIVTVTAPGQKTKPTPGVVTVTRATPPTPPPPHSATVSTATPATPPPYSATVSIPTPPTPGVVTMTSSPAHTDKYLKKIYRLLFAIL